MPDTHSKQELKRIFKFICKWKGFTTVSWHIGDDHIRLYLIIPPKYSVPCSIQVLKSKSANWLKKKTKRFPQGNLWAGGYFVSTIGINEHVIINDIKNRDHKRVDIEKKKLFSSASADEIETTSG
ncbi:MAG: IS200/IS605 family transposase [Candidatus Moranbacteria bacterium]|nr:IS200/IS605 family transposase [Candidatus Moranbacteria bacterium]